MNKSKFYDKYFTNKVIKVTEDIIGAKIVNVALLLLIEEKTISVNK